MKILKRISEILVKKELFDESKYEFIQAVIGLEIKNFLTVNEQNEIAEEIEMTPQAEQIVLQAIHEVNQKVLAEAEHKGKEKGRVDAMEEVAKSLKNRMDVEEVSEITGLTSEEIQKL